MTLLDINTLAAGLSSFRKAYYWKDHLIMEGEPSLKQQFNEYLKKNNLKVDPKRYIVRDFVPEPVLEEESGVIKFYDPLTRKVTCYVRDDAKWEKGLKSFEVQNVHSATWYNVLRILKTHETLKKDLNSKIVDIRTRSYPKYGTLEFCGASRQVGASCFLIQTDQCKILLDCGIGFGNDKEPTLNIDVSTIDYIILSHSHSDHSMYIPVLVRKGFKGKILSTKATLLTYYSLGKEALSIQKNQCLFELKDLEKSLVYFQLLEVGQKKQLDSFTTVEFFHANHALGSVMADICVRRNPKSYYRLLYTGDYKNDTMETQPFYKSISLDQKYNAVITEATYGCTDQRSKVESQLPRVRDLLKEFEKGTVLVPVFSNRAVQLLYYLSSVLDQQTWNRIRISPSVLSFFELTLDCPESLHTKTYEKLHQLWIKVKNLPLISQEFVEPNSIYVTPSGMMEGGSSSKLITDLASDEKNLILFTGFLSKNTLGSTLLNTPHRGYFTVTRNNIEQKLVLNAKKDITRFMSAHSNFPQIENFMVKTTVKSSKIYLVHGTQEALLEVKTALRKNNKLPSNVRVPYTRTRDRLF